VSLWMSSWGWRWGDGTDPKRCLTDGYYIEYIWEYR
jgi:hypothetical protein